MDTFVGLLVNHTYALLHLLEYTIWQIADPEGNIPLEQLLTPKLENIQRAPTPEEHAIILKTFATKSAAVNAQLTQGQCQHMVREWFPHAHSLAPGEWMNVALVRDYYNYLNIDGGGGE
jgi:hypothetical protein